MQPWQGGHLTVSSSGHRPVRWIASLTQQCTADPKPWAVAAAAAAAADCKTGQASAAASQAEPPGVPTKHRAASPCGASPAPGFRPGVQPRVWGRHGGTGARCTGHWEQGVPRQEGRFAHVGEQHGPRRSIQSRGDAERAATSDRLFPCPDTPLTAGAWSLHCLHRLQLTAHGQRWQLSSWPAAG